MEPITLAVLTSAVTTLATKAIEGFGEEAGKSLWGKVKTTLCWSNDPPPQDLAPMLAKQLDADEALASRVLELLKENQPGETAVVQQLVGQIHTKGGKITIIGSQTAQGDITNNF